jgi:signal transduction histidine kinase
MPNSPVMSSLDTVSDARMGLLVDAVQRLSLARTAEEIQAVVVGAARALTGADGATFVLRDGDECLYADEDAIAPLWKGRRFPLSDCISGWAMRGRQHVVVPDVYADERIPHETYRPTFVKSLVMMPIRMLDPIGSIGGYWADEHVPSDEDISLLRALADSTAFATENVRVLEQLDYEVRLLQTLAYEVRDPLSAAQALLHHVEQSAGPSEELALINDSLSEAMRIVGEQLEVARLEARADRVTIEDVELGPLLEALRDSFVGLSADGVELVAEVPAGLWVRTDPRVLGEIVRNLVGNALKFTDSGEVRITARGGEGQVVVAVSDTGVGIEPLDQERIFDEFQQVYAAQDGRRPGTGLGLPLARRLAGALDGRIEVVSEPGRGSCFSVLLPA